ncbi:hypothetical protein ACFL2A_06540 [Thermodesulfobacteriota bacterium]
MTDNTFLNIDTDRAVSLVDQVAKALTASKENITLFNAKGSFKSYVISELIKKSDKQFVIITSKQSEAERIFNDLRFFSSDDGICFYPCLDTLPYDKFLPQIEVTAKRMQILSKLLSSNVRCIVTSTKAVQKRVIPKSTLRDEQELIESGEEIEREKFLNRLISWGYTRTPVVEDPGEYAVRGNIIDIYIPSCSLPIRIELFSDLVESIREFDPLTQRSKGEISEVICAPVVETIYKRATKQKAVSVITEVCSDYDIEFKKRKELVEKIKEEVYFSELSNFTGAFYEEMGSLFDYCDDDAVIINLNPTDIKSVHDEHYNDIYARFDSNIKEQKISLPPEMVYLKPEESEAIKNKHLNIFIHDLELIDKSAGNYFKFDVSENDSLRSELLLKSANKKDIFAEHVMTDESRTEIDKKLRKSAMALKPLIDILSDGLLRKKKVVITARTVGQAERLFELLENYDIGLSLIDNISLDALDPAVFDRVIILTGTLGGGFISESEGLILITEEEIFGKRVKHSVNQRSKQVPTSK